MPPMDTQPIPTAPLALTPPSSESGRVLLETPRGRSWRAWFPWWIAGLSVVVAMSSVAANARYFQKQGQVVERWHSLSREAQSKVAIVDVAGAILGGSGFARQQLDRIEDDDSVRAIVLRVDSPGGTVAGSDELHHHLAKLVAKRDLPVVVSMGSIAASGGYYVAMANGGREDVIFAEPATLTGSIGVIIPHYDFSKALRRIDIADDSITSGPLKEMLSTTKDRAPELAERERAVLQSLVDDMFGRFKEVVKGGRPKLDEAAIDKVATGQVFTASQARDAGLVDRIGFLEDAVDRAVELAGLTKDTARVVRYVRPRGLLDDLLGIDISPTARAGGERTVADALLKRSLLDAFVEWTTPRAWYLCSWWPAIVASGN
ncbi:MAG: signal peptide peptidase SppA [Planctomycetota bacterium]|nr:MAG: signal peptide peptidase SppA [Planctomycetota bacterium]